MAEGVALFRPAADRYCSGVATGAVGALSGMAVGAAAGLATCGAAAEPVDLACCSYSAPRLSMALVWPCSAALLKV